MPIPAENSDFKKLFQQIDEIDKLCSISNRSAKNYDEKLKRGDITADILSTIKTKTETDKQNANEAIRAFLKLSSEHTTQEQYLYIQQIIQDIQKKYHFIPKDTPKLISFPKNEQAQTWGEFYDHDRYENLMLYCKLAYLEEKNGIPEEHALKLSVMFDEVSNALSYIQLNLKNNKLAIHDACLFTLPDPNECNFKTWKKLIKTNVNDKPFRDLLAKANDIELIIKNNQPGKGQKKANPNSLKAQKEKVEKLNRQFKELDRKHGSLTKTQEETYQNLIKKRSESLIELFKMSAGIELEFCDLAILNAANEVYIQKTQGAYRYMLAHGLTRNDFAKFVKLKRLNDDMQIPDIKIDGASLGIPGVYIAKVDVMDELQAAEAACFGKLTNCCQSLSGQAGEPCVIHGLTSPMGGFYVVKNEQGKVLAQCWAWRSKSGAIVFDSIEVSYLLGAEKAAQLLYNQLAHKLVNDKYTHKVACGEQSGISERFGRKSPLFNEDFVDYYGYSDSTNQRIIIDSSKPYLQFSINDEKSPTLLYIDNIMKAGSIDSNTDFIQMINWAVLEKEDKLITEIINLAEKNVLKDEATKIILTISDYLKDDQNRIKVLSKLTEVPYVEKLFTLKKETALIFAIRNDLKEIVQSLLTKSTAKDLNAQNALGNTAIILAAQNGDREIVQALIDKGADFNLMNRHGKNAIMFSAEKGHTMIFRALINAGADINTKDPSGNSLLMIAAHYGHLDLVQDILMKMPPQNLNLKNTLGCTALMLAAEKGDIKIVEALIDAGANLNITYLMNAARYYPKKGFEDLLLKKVKAEDLFQTSSSGNSYIISALKLGLTKLAKDLLINAKAEDLFNHITNSGQIMLTLASEYGYKEIVEILNMKLLEVPVILTSENTLKENMTPYPLEKPKNKPVLLSTTIPSENIVINSEPNEPSKNKPRAH
jgi:ankyrin repeat protein